MKYWVESVNAGQVRLSEVSIGFGTRQGNRDIVKTSPDVAERRKVKERERWRARERQGGTDRDRDRVRDRDRERDRETEKEKEKERKLKKGCGTVCVLKAATNTESHLRRESSIHTPGSSHTASPEFGV
jgi:hypothetical protein